MLMHQKKPPKNTVGTLTNTQGEGQPVLCNGPHQTGNEDIKVTLLPVHTGSCPYSVFPEGLPQWL